MQSYCGRSLKFSIYVHMKNQAGPSWFTETVNLCPHEKSKLAPKTHSTSTTPQLQEAELSETWKYGLLFFTTCQKLCWFLVLCVHMHQHPKKYGTMSILGDMIPKNGIALRHKSVQKNHTHILAYFETLVLGKFDFSVDKMSSKLYWCFRKC